MVVVADSNVRLVEAAPGYPVLEIEHPTCVARVALHGAHVMSWCPTGGEEVLYLSPEAVLREGKAIRGGIPICWPWFNAHPTNPELPAHGVARNRMWKLESQLSDREGVTLNLSLIHGDWKAVVTICLGTRLKVALESVNLGGDPFPVSGALHSYLSVGDVAEASVHGLEEAGFLDTVGDPRRRRQEGAVEIDREVDRIYDSTGDVRVVDPSMGRTILIEKEHSPSTVVWNPWREKAAALGDLPDAGYEAFVCVEAAIANDRAVVLESGESHRFSTTISVE